MPMHRPIQTHGIVPLAIVKFQQTALVPMTLTDRRKYEDPEYICELHISFS